jgi:hypothetical protein
LLDGGLFPLQCALAEMATERREKIRAYSAFVLKTRVFWDGGTGRSGMPIAAEAENRTCSPTMNTPFIFAEPPRLSSLNANYMQSACTA